MDNNDTPTPPFLPGASKAETCPKCGGSGWNYAPVGSSDTAVVERLNKELAALRDDKARLCNSLRSVIATLEKVERGHFIVLSERGIAFASAMTEARAALAAARKDAP